MKVTINISKIIKAKTSKGHEQNKAYQVVMSTIMPVFLKELLDYTSGNKTHAARVSGLDKGTVQRKLDQYGIAVEKVIKTEGVGCD